ncbi:ROK family protein [Actinomyces sp. B33]|uniref:ROK family protein n=1 Tax=Actinomyces sp. B33 TaxID=2942131 RepID=UPI00234203F4|nr:ROK family protein [Actinomyces sp. B33]MDC4233845.1 ROK family protein [Actinomyces sp. B33]
MTASLYAGIDVGGTAIKWMIVDAAGRIEAQGRAPTLRRGVAAQSTAIARRLSDEHPGIAGIGVICPGIVDEAAGRVVYASNLDLDGAALAEDIGGATGIPARLGHDGRAAGIAEGLMGAGRGASSFLMMPIGTGISMAVMLGGRAWAGASYCAGEIGHAPVFPDGETCGCGQRGCLEVYASATGLARRYRDAAGVDVGARGVEERLGSDPIADRVWGTGVHALAVSLTQMTLALDPERIVVGGGLSHAGPRLLDPLRAELADMLRWRRPPGLVAAELGDAAGRWGAAVLGARAAGASCYEAWEPLR